MISLKIKNNQLNNKQPSNPSGEQSTEQVVIAGFYRFTPMNSPRKLRDKLKSLMLKHGTRGTVLLAEEGINGTISGDSEAIDIVMGFLRKQDGLDGLSYIESYFHRHPFERTKIYFKKQIITFAEDESPAQKTGKHLEAKEWDKLISDKQTILLDIRNDYEIGFGKFSGAVNPKTKRFTDMVKYIDKNLQDKKDKKIAMYCTGGIRCEKLSSYMLEQGFDEVYQLKGGILKYLQQADEEKSKYQGKCYVFDERVCLSHGLEPHEEERCCSNCGHELFSKDRLHDDYLPSEHCRFCVDSEDNSDMDRSSVKI